MLLPDIEHNKYIDYYPHYQNALSSLNCFIDQLIYQYNSLDRYGNIEKKVSRIKEEESTVKKLNKDGLDLTLDSINSHLNDIVGMRLVFIDKFDLEGFISLLRQQDKIKIIKEKDYINNPKVSGYRSYHFILAIPNYLNDEVINCELQVRTCLMDAWSNSHHSIYKKGDNVSTSTAEFFRNLSEEFAKTDDKIALIREIELNNEERREYNKSLKLVPNYLKK